MRAVAVREFRGTPELLEVPTPTPGAGEVRVRLEGAGVNPFDWKIADGILKDRRPHVWPLVLGVDGAGTVDGVGAGVRRFGPGDRVFGQFLHDPVGRGTYAEFVTVPEKNALAQIPPTLSGWEAAALPTAGMTALDAIETIGLHAGDTLLVIGASGGIGSFVVPLAVAGGIRVVAVARSASHARLSSLGAQELIDVASADPIALVRQAHPAGVDGLLDVVSDAGGFARWTRTVRTGGVAATTVYSATSIPGLRTINIDLQPRTELLERLARSVVGGAVRPPVERTVPLAEAPSVVAEGRAGRLSGKTVIRISSDGGRADPS